jgi:hypothetical protein
MRFSHLAVLDGIALIAVRPPPPLQFTVDHPFIALVVDGLNKMSLFACRIADPTAS